MWKKKKQLDELQEETEVSESLEDSEDLEPQDDRNLGEKISDGVEGFFDGVQEAIYGENPSFTEDIPATIEKPSGVRKVNKVQTRRNFNKLLFSKRGFLILIGILLIIGGIVALCEIFI